MEKHRRQKLGESCPPLTCSCRAPEHYSCSPSLPQRLLQRVFNRLFQIASTPTLCKQKRCDNGHGQASRIPRTTERCARVWSKKACDARAVARG
jgi:hypothetical protein